MEKRNFFAVDLGATSGRTILGSIVDGKLSQRELTRFKNPIIEVGGHYFWDIFHLYNEIISGLKICGDENIAIESIGIDTWGVDFVCFGKDGLPLRNPYCYRDPYTAGMMEEYFKQIPKEKVYEKTGIQFMNFNSLFQLFAQKRMNDSALENAEKILFIPDALTMMLTGEAVCEYTILSTSQLLDPRTKKIDKELLDVVGLSESQFGRYVQPAEKVGVLSQHVQKLTGLGEIPVVAVAGHDTGAAVAAVPAKDSNFAYLSSGTWSLMGIETQDAIINGLSYERNFTNEGGIEGTTRFLKNICGMWIYERCRKEWKNAPESHSQLQAEAMECMAFQSLINPDDAKFANPEYMVDAIKDYCRETNQHIPEGYAEICRCIFDSLALRYRQVFDYLKEMAQFDINVLHIIGGGSMNHYLNQMTADSLNVDVWAGPSECTALGNIMLQAKAAGLVKDIWDMRQVIAASSELVHFAPHHTEEWDKAYEKFIKITNKN